MKPGASALTVIPERAELLGPPLGQPDDARLGHGVGSSAKQPPLCAASEAIVTTRPAEPAARRGFRAHGAGDVDPRLTSTTLAKCSSVISATGERPMRCPGLGHEDLPGRRGSPRLVDEAVQPRR